MKGVQNAQMQGPATTTRKDGIVLDKPSGRFELIEGTPVSRIDGLSR